MKKTFVSDEVKNRIINLRKSGASWLSIQDTTSVPRRTAKRVFEEWQESQAFEELTSARKQVAVELFNQHMRDLTNIAHILLENLKTPPSLIDRRDSAGILNNLFQTGIRIQGQEPTFFPDAPSDPEQVYRKNKMLFDSLKQHIKEGVNWSILDAWLSSRDKWKDGMDKLQMDINELVRNIIKQKINLRHNEQTLIIDETLVNRIVLGIVAVVYHALVEETTDFDQMMAYIHTSKATDAIVVTFGGINSTTELVAGSKELVERVIEICTWALENLFRGKESDTVKILANALSNMRKSKNQLDERLDVLRLIPLILHTKCELCPA